MAQPIDGAKVDVYQIRDLEQKPIYAQVFALDDGSRGARLWHRDSAEVTSGDVFFDESGAPWIEAPPDGAVAAVRVGDYWVAVP